MSKLSNSYPKTKTQKLNEDDLKMIDQMQNIKEPLSLKAKLSIGGFVVVSALALGTAYVNDNLFMDKIATCLFIISCVGLIRLLSGDVSRDHKN